MKIGKLTIENLKNLILNNIKKNRKEILTNPEIGGDCAIIEVGDKLLYLSSDPITGATEKIGSLIVNINANDIATSGSTLVGIMLTILAPPGTEKKELSLIIQEAQKECDILNMEILGGHTEITDAVNRIVVSGTVVGIGEKKDFNNRKKSGLGDKILITKGIGIEGTGIICTEKCKELEEIFGKEIIEEGQKYLKKISVVKDAEIAKDVAKVMHDVTEGGILGAIWEVCELFNLGAEIEGSKLKISEVTQKICDYYKLDPLRLISSGTMLIIVGEKDIELLQKKLLEENIESFEIGTLTEKKDKIILKKCGEKKGFKEERIVIAEPESDELYNVI